MALAFYRKYRPRSLADLIGQADISTILTNAAIGDRFAHAYLFFGPRGTGKTSTARILAKMANCFTRATDPAFAKKGIPCNECDACVAIEKGNALDVLEIDAASNRGIDEIRDLKEHIKTLPSSHRFKIIIIDEVHMLTTQAFNALLKTLEEPPAHAIFILATTEYEKVPPTIVSRTQKFHFKKIALQDIADNLTLITNQEQINTTRAALELVAYLAQGSMRDAQSLLDQIVSLNNKEVTVEAIERILGKVDIAKVIAMADACINKQLDTALALLYSIEQEGHNLFQLNKDLTEYLRRVLSLSLNPRLKDMFAHDFSQTELDAITAHAQKADSTLLVTLLKALLSAYAQMKYNPFPVVPLEVAIITSLTSSPAIKKPAKS